MCTVASFHGEKQYNDYAENVRPPRIGGEGMTYILAWYHFCTRDSSRNWSTGRHTVHSG